MKGLLVKDMLIIRSQVKIYLLMIGFFTLISATSGSGEFAGGFLMGILEVFPVMIPLTCASLDAQSRWEGFCPALPVSRAAIAGERYLLTLIVSALCALFGIAVNALLGDADGFEMLFGFAAVPLLVNAVMLPFVFRFGAERARLLFIGLMFAVFVVFYPLASGGEMPAFAGKITLLMVSAAAAALFAVSLLISIAIVRKKEY